MNIIVYMAIVVFIIVFSAIMHERDIYSACIEKGHSGYAGWTVKIKCSPADIDDKRKWI